MRDAASGNELENMSTTQWPWWWCHYHDHIWCFDVERTSHGGLIFPDSWTIVLQMLGLFPNLVPELWRIWRQFSGNWNGPKITFTGERVGCAGQDKWTSGHRRCGDILMKVSCFRWVYPGKEKPWTPVEQETKLSTTNAKSLRLFTKSANTETIFCELSLWSWGWHVAGQSDWSC